MNHERYMASRRRRELLPGRGSALSVDEAELLRQSAEDLLLTRPGQERLSEEATDRAARIVDMRGRLPKTHAALLHESVAAFGPKRPGEGPLKLLGSR